MKKLLTFGIISSWNDNTYSKPENHWSIVQQCQRQVSFLTCLYCSAEKIKLRFLTFVFVFLFSSGISEWRYDFTTVSVGIWQCLKQANLHFKLARNLISNTFQVYFRCTGCFNICACVMRSLHFFSRCQLESKLP